MKRAKQRSRTFSVLADDCWGKVCRFFDDPSFISVVKSYSDVLHATEYHDDFVRAILGLSPVDISKYFASVPLTVDHLAKLGSKAFPFVRIAKLDFVDAKERERHRWVFGVEEGADAIRGVLGKLVGVRELHLRASYGALMAMKTDELLARHYRRVTRLELSLLTSGDDGDMFKDGNGDDRFIDREIVQNLESLDITLTVPEHIKRFTIPVERSPRGAFGKLKSLRVHIIHFSCPGFYCDNQSGLVLPATMARVSDLDISGAQVVHVEQPLRRVESISVRDIDTREALDIISLAGGERLRSVGLSVHARFLKKFEIESFEKLLAGVTKFKMHSSPFVYPPPTRRRLIFDSKSTFFMTPVPLTLILNPVVVTELHLFDVPNYGDYLSKLMIHEFTNLERLTLKVKKNVGPPVQLDVSRMVTRGLKALSLRNVYPVVPASSPRPDLRSLLRLDLCLGGGIVGYFGPRRHVTVENYSTFNIFAHCPNIMNLRAEASEGPPIDMLFGASPPRSLQKLKVAGFRGVHFGDWGKWAHLTRLHIVGRAGHSVEPGARLEASNPKAATHLGTLVLENLRASPDFINGVLLGGWLIDLQLSDVEFSGSSGLRMDSLSNLRYLKIAGRNRGIYSSPAPTSLEGMKKLMYVTIEESAVEYLHGLQKYDLDVYLEKIVNNSKVDIKKE